MTLVTILCIIIAILSVALIITIACLIKRSKSMKEIKTELSWLNMSFLYED